MKRAELIRLEPRHSPFGGEIWVAVIWCEGRKHFEFGATPFAAKRAAYRLARARRWLLVDRTQRRFGK